MADFILSTFLRSELLAHSSKIKCFRRSVRKLKLCSIIEYNIPLAPFAHAQANAKGGIRYQGHSTSSMLSAKNTAQQTARGKEF